MTATAEQIKVAQHRSYERLIGTLAYLLWEKAGRPYGRDLEFWYRAEEDFRRRKK